MTEEEFYFERTDDGYVCYSPNGRTYRLHPELPSCTCEDFQFRKGPTGELCKHLKALSDQEGISIKSAEVIPETRSLLLVEEETGITIEDNKIKLPLAGIEKEILIPQVKEMSENRIKEAIKDAFGEKPRWDEVLQRIPIGKGIWDIKGEAALPLAKRLGVEVMPVKVQEVRKEMKVDENMPSIEVTAAVRVTALACWRDNEGKPHIGWGEKEEFLTSSRWKDYQNRGSNFLVDIATTKAIKKALFRSLPFTKTHLIRSLFDTFNWGKKEKETEEIGPDKAWAEIKKETAVEETKATEPEQPESIAKLGYIDRQWFKESLATIQKHKGEAWSDEKLLNYMRISYKTEGKTVEESVAKLGKGEAAHFVKKMEEALQSISK